MFTGVGDQLFLCLLQTFLQPQLLQQLATAVSPDRPAGDAVPAGALKTARVKTGE
jgi:hypothetical protein